MRGQYKCIKLFSNIKQFDNIFLIIILKIFLYQNLYDPINQT